MAVMASPETSSMVEFSHDPSIPVSYITKDSSPTNKYMDKSQCREATHDKSVPVKSGQENLTRPMLATQDPDDTCTTSRPSSSGEDVSQEDQELLNRNTAIPSARDVPISVKTIEKPSLFHTGESMTSFKFSQRSTVQQSHAASQAFHEKSNQQHQEDAQEKTVERKTGAARAHDIPEPPHSAAAPGLLTPILSNLSFEHPSVLSTTSPHHSAQVPTTNVALKTVLVAGNVQGQKPVVSKNEQQSVPPRRRFNGGGRSSSGTKAPVRGLYVAPRSTRSKKSANHSAPKPIPTTVGTTMEEENIFKIVDNVAPVYFVRKPDTFNSSRRLESHSQSSITAEPAQVDTPEAEVEHSNSVEEPALLVSSSDCNEEPSDCPAGSSSQSHATSENSEHQTAQNSQFADEMPQAKDTPTTESPVSPLKHNPSNDRSQAIVPRPLSTQDRSATEEDATKFPLHTVTNQCVNSKVTKRNARSTRGKTLSRKPTSSFKPSLGPYSSEELLELARFTLQQERLISIKEAAADVDSKTAEVQLVYEQSQYLANQLREMEVQKAELQKTADAEKQKLVYFQSSAGKFGKFLGEMSEDFTNLKKIRASYVQDFEQLQPIQADIRTDIKALGETVEHTGASLARMKTNSLQVVRESAAAVKSLTEANAYLHERLSEKVGMLTEERDRHLAFDQKLKDLQSQQKSVHDFFGECTDKIIDKLGGIENLVVENKPNIELLSLVKRCSEESKTLAQQGGGSVKNFGEVKELLQGLLLEVENHFIEYKKGEVSHLDAGNRLENQVTCMLESVKTNLLSQGDLASKNATLQENIAGFKEQLKSSEEKANALDSQISEYQTRETAFKVQIDKLVSEHQTRKAASKEQIDRLRSEHQTRETALREQSNKLISEHQTAETASKEQTDILEASIASLQRDLSSAESEALRIQELASDNKRLQTENYEAKTELVRSKTRIDHLSTQVTGLEGQKDELQRNMYTTNHLLIEANRARENFDDEKARIQQKAEKDLEDQTIEGNDTVNELSARHARLRKEIVHEKNVMERKLGVKASELEKMTAVSLEFEDLKKSKGLADDRIRGLQEELEKFEADKRENDAAEKEQATLKQKAQDELKGLQDQLIEAKATERRREIEFKNLEAGFRQESQERQKKVAEIQRGLESKLDTANNRITQQESLINQKDEALADLKRTQQTQIQLSFGPQTPSASTHSSQPSGVPGATPQLKKPRVPVNRNVRTRSQTMELAAQSQLEQSSHGYEGTPNDQSSKVHVSVFGPFSLQKYGPTMASEAKQTQQDDDEMLNLHPSYPGSEHPGSRPDTSQSEFINAHSLGSQEILDENGVQFVGSGRDEHTQAISSPLSSVPSNGMAMEAETQDALGRSAAQETLQSPGYDVDFEDQNSQRSQSELGSPQKTVRGKGRKVTPRPDSQPKAVEKEALSLTKPQRRPLPPVKTYGNKNQKKISNLDSGPHSFTNTRSSKEKQVRSAGQEVADDTISGSDPVSGPQRTPKRPAPQGGGSNKRARREVTTPSMSTPGSRSQQSKQSSPRRVFGTTQRSSGGSSKNPKTSGSTTERRRSSKSKLENDMAQRFNDEMPSR